MAAVHSTRGRPAARVELVCFNAAILSAAVLRKKERKYVDYYHSKSSFTFEMLKILNDRGSSVD